MTNLPLFGQAPMGTPAVDRIRAEMKPSTETLLSERWGKIGRISVSAARDPLGEWWVATWWHLDTVPEQNGALGGVSPLWPTHQRDRRVAIAQVCAELEARLPEYRGQAAKEIARIRTALARLREKERVQAA